MKWKTGAGAVCLALVLVLTGCAAKGDRKQEPPLPPGAPSRLEQITPQQSAQFQPVVNRYFSYRKQAVVAQDVEVLHREYPDLKYGMDRTAAINAESDLVARYRGLDVIDGTIAPEHYAPLKAQVNGDRGVLLVNGLELYLSKSFTDSGGQLQLLLFLERRGGVWTVVKTDETTDAEYHQALH